MNPAGAEISAARLAAIPSSGVEWEFDFDGNHELKEAWTAAAGAAKTPPRTWPDVAPPQPAPPKPTPPPVQQAPAAPVPQEEDDDETPSPKS